MLHPYPNDFPSEGIQMLIDVLQGNKPNVKEACHAGWHLLGFGLSKWDIHQVTAAAKGTDEEGRVATIEYLEGLKAKSKAGVQFTEDVLGIIPLPVIFFLISLLEKLFSGQDVCPNC